MRHPSICDMDWGTVRNVWAMEGVGASADKATKTRPAVAAAAAVDEATVASSRRRRCRREGGVRTPPCNRRWPGLRRGSSEFVGPAEWCRAAQRHNHWQLHASVVVAKDSGGEVASSIARRRQAYPPP